MTLRGMTRCRTWVCAVVLAATVWASGSAAAQIITLDRPAEGAFIVDKAGLITPDDADHIRKVCQRLQTENGLPLIVVTINAMRDHGAPDLRVETFATLLFDQWGIGHRDKNNGVLLLVSKQDRVSRIALGADWDRDADRATQRIMNDDIIPNFKAGRFSEGIRAGVDALDVLVRPREAAPPATAAGRTIASPSVPVSRVPHSPIQAPTGLQHRSVHPGTTPTGMAPRITHTPSSGWGGAIPAFFVVIVAAVLSSVKRLFGGMGSGGWGGGYRSSGWGGFFTGTHDHHHHHGGGIFGGGIGGHSGSSFGSGGSHSGGSFGGGHTRGGGATGSW